MHDVICEVIDYSFYIALEATTLVK